MTVDEAITALLEEFHLEDFEEVYRDEAREDPEFSGLTASHPKVQRFREVCRVLREARG